MKSVFCRLAPRIDLIGAFASTTGMDSQIKAARKTLLLQARSCQAYLAPNSVRSAISMNVFELLIDGRSLALVKAIKGEIIITFDNPDRKPIGLICSFLCWKASPLRIFCQRNRGTTGLNPDRGCSVWGIPSPKAAFGGAPCPDLCQQPADR